MPKGVQWSLDATVHVLESVEVGPGDIDDPDAGDPPLARQLGLGFVLSTIQDIIHNLMEQVPDPDDGLRFKAFEYYFRQDAFLSVK